MSADEEGRRTGSPMSLQELARTRAGLYEKIGRIKAELAVLDLDVDGSPVVTADSSPSDGELVADSNGTASCRSDAGEPDVDCLLARNRELSALLRAAREENDALRRAVKASEEAVDAANDGRARALEEKVKISARLSRAVVERDKAIERIGALEAKLKRVKAGAEAILAGQEQEKTRLEHRLGLVSDELASTKEQLKHRSLELASLKKRVAELEDELSSRLELVDGTQRRLDELQHRLAERDERIEALERRLEQAAVYESRAGQLTEELARAEELARTLGERAERQAEELEELREQLSGMDGLRSRLNESGRELESLKGSLEALRGQLDAVERERDKLLLLREAGKKRMAAMEAENTVLQDELARTAENLAEVQRLMKMMEETGL